MAIASGQTNIAKHLIESNIDPDHKSEIGQGALQLATNIGGKNQTFFKWLQGNAKDADNKPLVLTNVKSLCAKEEKSRGYYAEVYRIRNCLDGSKGSWGKEYGKDGKGHSPTEKGDGMGNQKGNCNDDLGCWNCGAKDHFRDECPSSTGKGKSKGSGDIYGF